MAGPGHAQRGRKDPTLQKEIDASARRARAEREALVEAPRTEDVPEGVVHRRGRGQSRRPAPPPEPEVSTDLYDDYDDQNDQVELEQEGDVGESLPDELPMLYEGAVVKASTSVNLYGDGYEGWNTYQASDRLQPGESEEDAFNRVGWVVNTRVMDLAADADERARIEVERRRRQEIDRPIRSRPR